MVLVKSDLTIFCGLSYHGPTSSIQINVLRSDPRVQLANDANRLAALRVALLLLPNEFSIMDLFTTIVGLSYSGDFRTMIGAENPNKIRNIASAQAPLLFDIYKPLLDLSNDVVILRGGENWVQATDPRTRARLISALPSSFRKRVYAGFGGIADGNVMANSVAASGDLEHLVKSGGSFCGKRPYSVKSDVDTVFASLLTHSSEKDHRVPGAHAIYQGHCYRRDRPKCDLQLGKTPERTSKVKVDTQSSSVEH